MWHVQSRGMASRTRSKLKILANLGENIYRTTKPFRLTKQKVPATNAPRPPAL